MIRIVETVFYHFVFQIDDLEKTTAKRKNRVVKAAKDREYAETRASDPDGNYFDLSEHGFLDINPTAEKRRTNHRLTDQLNLSSSV